MPQVNIDGTKLDFEDGETIIQVAQRNDVAIPFYCWHPRLSVAANCRMCLVEVEGAPKLMPACHTPCRDGMNVTVSNERVRDAQRAVHEFVLINHPLDCPICDQAGECELQDTYMEFDLRPGRMVDAKQPHPRLEHLGPNVVYNGDRCILCTRCVRFMDEIAKDRQLGVFQRGDHAHIGVMPGQQLDHPYALNTVDVCPVGALTSTVFRFKQRVWNLRRSDSICGGCAKGCNVYVDQRSAQVYRLLPRANDAVNQVWMCDAGRLTYARANQNRLTTPLMSTGGGNGERPPAKVTELRQARRRIREILTAARDGDGKDLNVGVALSLHATVEEAYILGRLAKEVLGATSIALLGYDDGTADDFLRAADQNPNRAGITAVLGDLDLGIDSRADLEAGIRARDYDALLVVGHELSDPEGLATLAEGLGNFVHVAHARTALAEAADVTLPSLAWVQLDGTWVNGERRAQGLRPAFPPVGDARPSHEWLMEIAAELGLGFALPSPQTIRAEIERHLESFKGKGLTDLGPLGREL